MSNCGQPVCCRTCDDNKHYSWEKEYAGLYAVHLSVLDSMWDFFEDELEQQYGVDFVFGWGMSR